MSNRAKILNSEKETEEFAKKLAKRIRPGAVLAFYGDLGSGKTTFIKYLAKALGIKRRLISPTFVILKSYKDKKFNFHHVDLYRIKSSKEIESLGLIQLFSDPTNIIVIEWAEKMEKLLPRDTTKVYLSYIDKDKRAIRINASLPAGRNVDLQKAVEIIKNGGILIFPTDTAFGMGCRIDNEESLRRLFEIRKRPKDKAVPVLFDSIEQVRKYVLPFDKNVEFLMKKYWPGALTVVLKCKVSKVPILARGGGDTLGVRIPDYKPILDLIRRVGVPIVGTSANIAGEKTPFSFEDLDKSLIDQTDGVLVAVQGEALNKGNHKQTSTVIDCTRKPWRILREGAVKVAL